MQCWNDISVFIKVGCLKDEDFYSKVKDILIFKDLNGEYKNLDEFLGVAPESETAEDKKDEEKKPVSVYYVSDEVGQSQYVNMFKNAGLTPSYAIRSSILILSVFSNTKIPKNGNSCASMPDIDSALKDGEVNADDFKDLTESFKNSLKNTSIAVKAEKFKSADVPAIINVSEFTRRFSEMNAFYGLAGGDADRDMTIILNTEIPS